MAKKLPMTKDDFGVLLGGPYIEQEHTRHTKGKTYKGIHAKADPRNGRRKGAIWWLVNEKYQK